MEGLSATRCFDASAFLARTLDFTRALRNEGLTADLAAVLDFTRALSIIDIGQRDQVRAAGAALFVRRPDEREPYDRVFDRFWRIVPTEHRGPGDIDRAAAPSPDVADPDRAVRPRGAREGAARERAGWEASEDAATDPAAVAAQLEWSRSEAFRHREFERMTAAELREAERLMDRLVPRIEQRRTRRWRLHAHGRQAALRPMFRRNLAAGGDPVAWLWRRRTTRPRSVVLICDVSGSMERHARLLLRLGHALIRSRVPTEAFVFGTRLTRVTRALGKGDPEDALDRVSASVADWSGGTRIGESFREFNRRWARRVLRSSGIVVIVSDGWDRGDPALVGEETARLRRSCHRLVWLNPLAGDAGYEPLAAGMAAAYPHIDRFLPANDLASLSALADVLAGMEARA